jgi:hypothetical protein
VEPQPLEGDAVGIRGDRVLSVTSLQLEQKEVARTTVAPILPAKAAVLTMSGRGKTRERGRTKVAINGTPVYTTMNAVLGLPVTPTNPAYNVQTQAGTPSDITTLPISDQNTVIATGEAPASLPVETAPTAFSNQSLSQQLAQVAKKGTDILVQIPVSVTATQLPAYTESTGSVKGVIVANPSTNSNPIVVSGITVAPGGSFVWTTDEENTTIDPTTITLVTSGQTVVVNYVIRNA